ncbi:MAG TPA: hypothetical protein PK074_09345 [Spirochaetales bacterium]|nr:hypothetical protein [Spirochaetales bacterium]
MKKYPVDFIKTEEAVEGLVYKKLARKAAGQLIIEPVIELFIKTMLSADRLWIVSHSDNDKPILIIRGQEIWLLITHYSLNREEWKITPFPDMFRLTDELGNELSNPDITTIKADGSICSIKYDDSFLWLKED